MQRDIGNEVIVAIIVVGVLAFALTFGIILSLSNPGTDNSDRVVLSNVATESSTVEVAAAASETSDSETPSATAAETEDAVDSATDTPTLSATASTAPTSTPTQEPSDTPTASHTATLVPTETASATSTRRSTATPAPTQTHTPTDVPTRTATRTPTVTTTSTVTPSRTPTRTSSPTATRTLTRTPTSTPSATPTAGVCVAPFGWVIYIFQSGMTLDSLAEATGSTSAELREANCLPADEPIGVGDILYVPRSPTSFDPDSDAAAGALVPQGCTYPGTVVTSPVPAQRVSGMVPVRGTAFADDFAYYRIEIRPDSDETFSFYSRSTSSVINGQLGTIDTGIFAPGLYWVRVSVVDTTGEVGTTPCTIPVIIE